MKYEIDTIPVWDALKAGTECLLCLLEKRSRQASVRYYLGPSVMVPEVRVEVNKTGFRPENLRLLAKDPNKLGLALISHTRLKAAQTAANRFKASGIHCAGSQPKGYVSRNVTGSDRRGVQTKPCNPAVSPRLAGETQ